ncbi:sterile alpha motif domain-containing protein 3-like isoform X1 [Tachysurus ichikawai]
MESKRLEIVEEMKKRHPSSRLIAQYMDTTFSPRRKELVEKEPSVKETLERWPALFRESQIIAEFNRITSKNLKQEFCSALDTHTSRFLEVFESKKGTAGKKRSEYLMQMKSANITDVTAQWTTVLCGLAVLLGEDTTDFFKTCFVSILLI